VFRTARLGRPWLAALRLFPYPTRWGSGLRVSEPVDLDVFAVSDVCDVALLFWYIGGLCLAGPPCCRAGREEQYFNLSTAYFVGWRGSSRQSWRNRIQIIFDLAGLSTGSSSGQCTRIRVLDFCGVTRCRWHSRFFSRHIFRCRSNFAGSRWCFFLYSVPLRHLYPGFRILLPHPSFYRGKVMWRRLVIVGYLVLTL